MYFEITQGPATLSKLAILIDDIWYNLDLSKDRLRRSYRKNQYKWTHVYVFGKW